jgi:hypothetical protein
MAMPLRIPEITKELIASHYSATASIREIIGKNSGLFQAFSEASAAELQARTIQYDSVLILHRRARNYATSAAFLTAVFVVAGQQDDLLALAPPDPAGEVKVINRSIRHDLSSMVSVAPRRSYWFRQTACSIGNIAPSCSCIIHHSIAPFERNTDHSRRATEYLRLDLVGDPQ